MGERRYGKNLLEVYNAILYLSVSGKSNLWIIEKKFFNNKRAKNKIHAGLYSMIEDYFKSMGKKYLAKNLVSIIIQLSELTFDEFLEVYNSYLKGDSEVYIKGKRKTKKEIIDMFSELRQLFNIPKKRNLKKTKKLKEEVYSLPEIDKITQTKAEIKTRRLNSKTYFQVKLPKKLKNYAYIGLFNAKDKVYEVFPVFPGERYVHIPSKLAKILSLKPNQKTIDIALFEICADHCAT